MRIILFAFTVISLLISCKKDKVDDPDFEVSTPSLTYKVSDSIHFVIAGNPDNITFFSGEANKKYQFKDRVSESGQVILKFTSYVQYLNADNGFKLLISANFKGATDSANIKAATWTDITNKAILSTGADNTASGDVDISEFAKKDVPVTLAFKYVDKPKSTSAQRQATWTIKNFAVNNLLKDGTISPLINMAMNTWGSYSFSNTGAAWVTSATQLQMAGGVYTSAENEDWLLTKSIDLTFVKSDVGAGLKNTSTNISNYSYKYATPGVYTAVFEASNANYKGIKKATKEFTFTITP